MNRAEQPTANLTSEQGPLAPTQFEQALPELYQDLRELSGRAIRRQPPGFTLCATDLLHEAILRLCRGSPTLWQDRAHVYRAVALATRRALVDHARRRGAQKRAGAPKQAVDGWDPVLPVPEADILALDDLLCELDIAAPRKAQVVELRFFGGLSAKEIADALGLSIPTVERDCRTALAFLAAGLRDG